MAKAYVVDLTGTRKLDNPEAMSELLDVLHQVSDFVPTHWGIEEQERRPYDQTAFLQAFVDARCSWSQLLFTRDKAPRYSARLSPYWSGRKPGSITIELKGKLAARHPKLIFELGSALAVAIDVAYGMVNPEWDLADHQLDYLDALRAVFVLQEFGPGPPGARTWFGHHLVDLVGREVLQAQLGVTRDLHGGALESDLVADPWNADVQALLEAQRPARKRLEATGFFGDYATEGHRRAPTPGWVPVPFEP